MPMPFEPMLCQVGSKDMLDRLPTTGYIIEPKLDGQRILAERKNGEIRLWTRRGLNCASKFPEVIEELWLLPAMDWLLDGELTVGGDFCNILKRNTDDKLKIRIMSKKMPATFWVFDILKFGEMLMVNNVVLSERKAILKDFLVPSGRVEFVPSVTRSAREYFEQYTEQGGEGVVVKRSDSRYEPGVRSAHWLKVKKWIVEDVQVIGATRSDAGLPFAALILAQGSKYYGKVGTGFSHKDRGEILATLKAHCDAVGRYELPRDIRAQVLLECSPIEAEIKLMEKLKGSPRFPVWLRFRRV